MDEWDVTEELPSFKEQFQSLMTADSEIEIVDLFERLLVLATDWRQKMQTGHTEQLAMHAKRIIEQQFADSELSVGRLAEELGITPNYLSRLFHRFTGKTVSEYMTATRIEAACELLRQTSLKVLDIAEQVGYTNGHYFSMVFKKHTGHSPGAYRDKGGSGS
ncbi:HTH-type transcriptional activator Btr [compost metagenome]